MQCNSDSWSTFKHLANVWSSRPQNLCLITIPPVTSLRFETRWHIQMHKHYSIDLHVGRGVGGGGGLWNSAQPLTGQFELLWSNKAVVVTRKNGGTRTETCPSATECTTEIPPGLVWDWPLTPASSHSLINACMLEHYLSTVRVCASNFRSLCVQSLSV